MRALLAALALLWAMPLAAQLETTAEPAATPTPVQTIAATQDAGDDERIAERISGIFAELPAFAAVEVAPVVETSDHVEIDEKELRVDVYRSSGPGGQGVNTTDSAVRRTHLPTNIVVSCQNERSQMQNKAAAMVVLQAKLLDRRRQEERAVMDSLKDTGDASFGNQMRSYVLHPYQMVKDLRTNYEVNNPGAVLDGNIDGFIEAGIRWRRNEATSTD